MKKISIYCLIIGFVGLQACDLDVQGPPTFDEQLAIDIELIDSYLFVNDIDAQIDENSGIRYVRVLDTEGISPTLQDEITVKYVGKLLNNSIFDSNTTDEGYTGYLAELIWSWRIMVPKMNVGGKMTIYAPSVYCYGNNNLGNISKNSSLIFEIELLSIN